MSRKSHKRSGILISITGDSSGESRMVESSDMVFAAKTS